MMEDSLPVPMTPRVAGVVPEQLIRSGPAFGSIQRFADSKLQEQIDRAVAQLPENAGGSVIAAVNSKGEAVLGVVARLGDQWSVVGALDHAPGESWKEWDAAVAGRFTWPRKR